MKLKEKPNTWRVLLLIFWTLEIYILQEFFFGFDYKGSLINILGSKLIRFSLTGTIVAGLLLLMSNRFVLVLLFASQLFLFLFLSIYKLFFDQIPTAIVLKEQFSEGMQGFGFSPEFFIYLFDPFFMVLIIGFVFKLILLIYSKGSAPLWGFNLLFLYFIILSISLAFIDRPSKLKSFASTERFASTYGLVVTWINQLALLDDEGIIEKMRSERNRMEKRPVFNFGGIPDFVPTKIVVIQVESFGWSIFNLAESAAPKFKFLDWIENKSCVFRLSPIKYNGSADSDFLFLSAVPPSKDVVPYKVRGLNTGNWLPHLLSSKGYETNFFHGNSASFFSRGNYLNEDLFDYTFFQKELLSKGLSLSKWGVHDLDVAEEIASQVQLDPEKREFFFFVTLTSHYPFSYLPAGFGDSSSDLYERYIHSMLFLEKALETIYQSLPEGSLFIIYGDHPPSLPEKFSGQKLTEQTVPLIINTKGKSRCGNPHGMIRELDMFEFSRWMHSFVRRF